MFKKVIAVIYKATKMTIIYFNKKIKEEKNLLLVKNFMT